MAGGEDPDSKTAFIQRTDVLLPLLTGSLLLNLLTAGLLLSLLRSQAAGRGDIFTAFSHLSELSSLSQNLADSGPELAWETNADAEGLLALFYADATAAPDHDLAEKLHDRGGNRLKKRKNLIYRDHSRDTELLNTRD